MAVSKGHAALAAARREQKNIRKRKKMRQEITEIAGEGFAYAKGQYDVSQTAWDEYESGYEEVTGEKYTGERGGMFSMPKGEVTAGERIYSKASLTDIGKFKKTLGESPEGLMNYDRIMGRYKEMNVSSRLVPGLGSEPSTEPYMVPVRDEYSAVGGTDYIPDNEALNKPSAWSKFKGGIKKAYDWEKERQVGVQQRRSQRMGFDSQNVTGKVTVGESYGPPNPNKGTSTRSSGFHEELKSRYGKDWKNKATNTGMDEYLNKPRTTDPTVGNMWDFQLKNNKKLNEGSYRK